MDAGCGGWWWGFVDPDPRVSGGGSGRCSTPASRFASVARRRRVGRSTPTSSSRGTRDEFGEAAPRNKRARGVLGGERAPRRINDVLARRLGIRKEEARKLRVLYSRVRRRRRRSSRYVSRSRAPRCHLLPHGIRLPAARKRPKRVPLPRVVRPPCLTLSMPGIYGGDGAGGQKVRRWRFRMHRSAGVARDRRFEDYPLAAVGIDAAPCTRTTRTSHTPRPPRPRRWRPAQPP